ncbi:MAG: hypothetical protein ABGW49_00285 [Nitrosopumilus sp.]|jgi:hypothetical protein|nr:hypothetical protein [Nitrosopumilus sp.]
MSIEAQYDQFISTINQSMVKVDPNLAVKIMYLERKFPDVAPRVELDIEYNDGVDLERKQEIVRFRYGFQIQQRKHGFVAVGRISVGVIEEFSKDMDVKYITGNATPSSY